MHLNAEMITNSTSNNDEPNSQPIAGTSNEDKSTTSVPTAISINRKRIQVTDLDTNAPKTRKVSTWDDCEEFGRLVSVELNKIEDQRRSIPRRALLLASVQLIAFNRLF
ncbi:hypothetical protein QE152_g17969 [Popillia japonica]|uniref:Uncharacterized protein n=1 Tax=Popillia japonica TaxID=7064 RepID=A0AAW1L513_POPJA